MATEPPANPRVTFRRLCEATVGGSVAQIAIRRDELQWRMANQKRSSPCDSDFPKQSAGAVRCNRTGRRGRRARSCPGGSCPARGRPLDHGVCTEKICIRTKRRGRPARNSPAAVAPNFEQRELESNMKRAFATIGFAIFAAAAFAQTTPSTADFVKMVAISDMFEVEFEQTCFGEKSRG